MKVRFVCVNNTVADMDEGLCRAPPVAANQTSVIPPWLLASIATVLIAVAVLYRRMRRAKVAAEANFKEVCWQEWGMVEIACLEKGRN